MNALDIANKRKRRVFYCRRSDTIRQAPQNYLLACRPHPGRPWYATPDRASTINAHSLGLVLDQWQGGSTAEALCDSIEIAFWGELPPGR